MRGLRGMASSPRLGSRRVAAGATAALVAAAMTAVTGCGGSSGSGAQGNSGPIQLGAVLTMTGTGSYYGKHQLAAIKMAIADVNGAGGIDGRKVQLTYQDARSTNPGALSALNKVLESDPTAIVGPVFGTEMLAMQPVIDRRGIPTTTISGTEDVTHKGSKNIFRTDDPDHVVKNALVDYVVNNLHHRKFGLIVTDDAWGFSGRDAISARLKKYGLKPVDVETHGTSDTNMTAQLTKLKDAGADVIVTQGYTPDTAIIMKEAQSLNLGIPVVTSTDGQLAATLDITAPKDVQGIYAAGLIMPDQPYPPDPKVAKWAAHFKQSQGFAPSLYSLVQYDGVMALFEAMKKSGADADSVRQGLHEISYKGFNGTLKADQFGDMMDTAQLYRFGASKNGIWLKSVTG